MLYKLRDQVSVFEDNPELHSIPEFSRLYTTTSTVKESDRDRRMRFVILVSDRKSPLRTLPDKERREKAARIVGYPMEGNRLDKNGREVCSGKNEAVEAAIVKYREYQYDENQDMLDAINTQILEIKEFIKSNKKIYDDKGKATDRTDGKAVEQALKLSKQLPELYEAKQKLEEILNVSTENKPEITTYSASDIPEEVVNSGETNAIEMWHQSRNK